MSKLIQLPGLIDIHVHLRDPGLTYKEDFYTGTSAALAGGVVTVFDMPNNLEPILTIEKLLKKIDIVKKKAVCNWGLYFGSDGKNINEFEKAAKKVVGLKIYLNFTTGRLAIENDDLVEKVFKSWPKEKTIVVHAEDERIELVLNFCGKYKKKTHITHVSQRKDLEKIIDAKKNRLNLTCDTTPHYLFLTKNDEKKLGALGKVIPQLSSQKDQDYLWSHLQEIDCIASDHAPHLLAEKKSVSPSNGLPGLETTLPLLITAWKEKRITLKEIIRMTNINPQKIFNYKQDENTFTEIDVEEYYVIENKNLMTKCGWSPYAGRKVFGKIKQVYLGGKKAFSEGKILIKHGFGNNIF